MEDVVYERRPIYVIQLARFVVEQLLELNPSLDVREVQELFVTVPALRLQGYEAHGLAYKDKLLCGHRILTYLIVKDELSEMLLGKLNSFCGFVIADELHYL